MRNDILAAQARNLILATSIAVNLVAGNLSVAAGIPRGLSNSIEQLDRTIQSAKRADFDSSKKGGALYGTDGKAKGLHDQVVSDSTAKQTAKVSAAVAKANQAYAKGFSQGIQAYIQQAHIAQAKAEQATVAYAMAQMQNAMESVDAGKMNVLKKPSPSRRVRMKRQRHAR